LNGGGNTLGTCIHNNFVAINPYKVGNGYSETLRDRDHIRIFGGTRAQFVATFICDCAGRKRVGYFALQIFKSLEKDSYCQAPARFEPSLQGFDPTRYDLRIVHAEYFPQDSQRDGSVLNGILKQLPQILGGDRSDFLLGAADGKRAFAISGRDD
jgi:hypothetical protein